MTIYVDNFADMVTLLVSDDHKVYKQWSDREDRRLDFTPGFRRKFALATV
jgi:hypothetical protein